MIQVKPRIRKFVTGGLSDSIYYTPVQTYLPRASEHLDASLFQVPVQPAVPMPELDKDLFKGEGYINERRAVMNEVNGIFSQLNSIDPSDIRYGNREIKLAYNQAQSQAQQRMADLKQSRDQNDKVEQKVFDNKAEGEKFIVGSGVVVKDHKTGELKKVSFLDARINPNYEIMKVGDYASNERKNNPLMAFNNSFAGDAVKINGYDSDTKLVNELIVGLGNESTSTIGHRMELVDGTKMGLGNFFAKMSKGHKYDSNEKQLATLIQDGFTRLPENIKNTLYGRAWDHVGHHKTEPILDKDEKITGYREIKDAKGNPVLKTAEEFNDDVRKQAQADFGRLLSTKLVREVDVPSDFSMDTDAQNQPMVHTNAAIEAALFSNGTKVDQSADVPGLSGKGGIGIVQSNAYVIPLDKLEIVDTNGIYKMGYNNDYLKSVAGTGRMMDGKELKAYSGGEALDHAVMTDPNIVYSNNVYRISTSGQLVPVLGGSAKDREELAEVIRGYEKEEILALKKDPNLNRIKFQEDFLTSLTDKDGKPTPIVVRPTAHSEIMTVIPTSDYNESLKVTHGKESKKPTVESLGLKKKDKPIMGSYEEPGIDFNAYPKVFKKVPEGTTAYRNFAKSLYLHKFRPELSPTDIQKTNVDNSKLEQFMEGRTVVTTVILNPYTNTTNFLNHVNHFVSEGPSWTLRSNLHREQNSNIPTQQPPLKQEKGGLIPNRVPKFELNIKPILLSDLY
jgi:hypothetical protein